jgi:hydrogenase expression/formation protein HypC
MCLAVPGCLVERESRDGLLLGTVDFGGVCRSICLETLPEARVGDWLLVHAGIALQKLEPDDAHERRAILAGQADEP